MNVSATMRTSRLNHLRSTLLIAALLVACFGTVAAQSPMPSDAEMLDLRREARSMHVAILPVPAGEPTAAEMRDLRLESRLAAVASGWGPTESISGEEMRDLRHLARHEQVARWRLATGSVR